jgi:hypothetical protein
MMKASGLRVQAHDKQPSNRSANLLFCYVLKFYEIETTSEDIQPKLYMRVMREVGTERLAW